MRIYDIIESPEFRRNMIVVPMKPHRDLLFQPAFWVAVVLAGCTELILGLYLWQHVALWFALHRTGAL